MFFFDHALRASLLPRSLIPKFVNDDQRVIAAFLMLPEKERLQSDVPQVWKRALKSDVISALSQISHDKCAFCESRATSLQPYRFRPPAYAVPSKNPQDRYSYLWLTFNWENFFPICSDCLPSDKSYFPVTGQRAAPPESAFLRLSEETAPGIKPDEKAILYYPGELSRPRPAFDFSLDGTLSAGNPRAEQTIRHFQLKPERAGLGATPGHRVSHYCLAWAHGDREP